MHLVYLVRPGENPELRSSLRSVAANLPADTTVTIAGHKPAWVTGVHHLPTEQRPGAKHLNAYGNLQAALASPDVPETFVLMNDDFYVTAPLEQIPVLNQGRTVDVLARYRRRFPAGSAYIDAMQATHDWLVDLGHTDPLCYELHIPMTLTKTGLRQVLGDAQAAGLDPTRVHYRTAYGNTHGVGGVSMDDVKVYDRTSRELAKPFASTHDVSYGGRIGRTLRATFPDPSRYECPPAAAA